MEISLDSRECEVTLTSHTVGDVGIRWFASEQLDDRTTKRPN